ncbi:MAG: VOC family protein [Proteobacteria bacterium]|nr:VOC family protein [Pseudomonadota bacterium]
METAAPLRPFHLAVAVRDIEESRAFYGSLLGCSEGRSAAHWVDFNLYGHQFVCHLNPALGPEGRLDTHHNPVDGHDVPVPHFGVVLDMASFQVLAARLEKADIKFVVEPHIRFAGEPGEQATMFFTDPSGNALEFKAFNNLDALFAT